MRKIIHCDADCFFAAVEMRDDPALRSVPMAVGGDSRRGVVSTCNYEARRFGIHSAMPTRQALTLCPGLVLIRPNMEKYREISRSMGAIFHDCATRVEMASLDEAYLDVSDSELLRGSASLIAGEVRRRVRENLGITLSAGVARSKFLAKVASDWRKPDGLFVITPDEEADFLTQLPVRKIHGVGPVTATRLERLGIHTGGDVLAWPLAELVRHFGRFGSRLHEYARGIDDRPVKPERTRKSLSVEHTFTRDLASTADCLRQAGWLHEKLVARLDRVPSRYRIRKLQVKVRFSDFRQTTLEAAGGHPEPERFEHLLCQALRRQDLPVRLLGLGVQFGEMSTGSEQLKLFIDSGPNTQSLTQ